MKKTIFKTTLILLCLSWLSPILAQNQIVGTVNYHDDPNAPVPAVVIDLFDMNNNLIQTTTTNDNGEYAFANIPNGSYYMVSSTSLDPGQVTLQDAFLIMMHLFGLYDFTDYEFAAADVNGSGTITWSDYFMVLINYILQGQPFPIGEWQFQSVQIDFNSRTLGTTDTATVWATGSGDLEGIWNPTGRSLALVSSNVAESITLSNDIQRVEITSNYPELISGFNLHINYPSNLMTITGVEGPDDNLSYAIEDGLLKVIWMDESENAGSHVYGDHLCTLLVSQNSKAPASGVEIMTTNDEGMVLNNRGVAVEGIEINLPAIKSGEFSSSVEAEVYPNPVVNQLNINIRTSREEAATLTIFDISGSKVHQSDWDLNTGENQVISMEASYLTPGTYTYQITSNHSKNTIASGRFFKSK